MDVWGFPLWFLFPNKLQEPENSLAGLWERGPVDSWGYTLQNTIFTPKVRIFLYLEVVSTPKKSIKLGF